MSTENKSEQFDPKAFLGAKVISPLEQEKLVGGTAAEEKEKEREREREKAID